MQEFLEFVIRQLIDYPEEMVITRVEEARKVIFRLRVRQPDVGKVIGKHGHTIAAIRNLLNAAAARHGQRAQLQIIEYPQPSGMPAPAPQTTAPETAHPPQE